MTVTAAHIIKDQDYENMLMLEKRCLIFAFYQKGSMFSFNVWANNLTWAAVSGCFETIYETSFKKYS